MECWEARDQRIKHVLVWYNIKSALKGNQAYLRGKVKIIESALLFPSSFCQLNPKVTPVKLKSLLISVWYGFLLDHCLRSCFVSLVFQSSFILPKFSGLNSYSLQNQRTEIYNFLFILYVSQNKEKPNTSNHMPLLGYVKVTLKWNRW